MNRWINFSDKEIEYLISKVDDEKIKTKLKKSLNIISISSRKSKGRNLQHYVCQRLSELLNISYDQKDDNCLIHSREMGQSGTDVVLRGEARKRFPYAIECKSGESISLYSTVIQAKNNITGYKNWIIVIKSKRFNEPLAILEWKEFEEIWRSKNEK